MTTRTGRVTCELTISADGYSAGLNQTEERPFGDDGGDGWGDKLHAWVTETPEENRAELDQLTAAKAFIIGRNMFGPVRGGRGACHGWPVAELHRRSRSAKPLMSAPGRLPRCCSTLGGPGCARGRTSRPMDGCNPRSSFNTALQLRTARGRSRA